MDRLTTFSVDGQKIPITFLSTEQVKEGVECDVYSFASDTTRDLAVVRVRPGHKTPLQKIVDGEQTIEGYVSGAGRLTVKKGSGEIIYREFMSGGKNLPVEVQIGESMQWEATGDSVLTFYELCTPPYVDGRFENQD